MQFKDYYAALGIEPSAGEADIKKAYRRLARKYHPDVSKEAGAEEQFKTINEAYEVLKDPQKRAAYDRLRAQGYRSGDEVMGGGVPPQGFQFDDLFSDAAGRNSGFSHFFESLFANQHGRFRSASGAHSAATGPGKMQRRSTLRVPLEAVYRGETIRIQIDGRQLDVKIPRGIQPGQVIRLSGHSQQEGQILLDVEYVAHPLFAVDGLNILHTLRVPPWQAALGASVSVPTLGGPVTLKIPQGSDIGCKLRLRGRGLERGGAVGDQIVALEITVPQAVTAKQRKAYQELADAFA